MMDFATGTVLALGYRKELLKDLEWKSEKLFGGCLEIEMKMGMELVGNLKNLPTFDRRAWLSQ